MAVRNSIHRSTTPSARKSQQLLATAAMTGLLAGAATLQTGCKNDSTKSDSGSAMTQPGSAATTMAAQHSCKGQNACKGQGGCKTDGHECKGKNACKGQGGCSMT